MASSTLREELCSIHWFCTYMRLHNRGVTLTVTPAEYMPTARALAEFWGPPSSSRFTFKDQGNLAHEVYLRQLFSRVLQLPWLMSGILPFQFARDLLVEALGIEVNWTDFAHRQTHLQS